MSPNWVLEAKSDCLSVSNNMTLTLRSFDLESIVG